MALIIPIKVKEGQVCPECGGTGYISVSADKNPQVLKEGPKIIPCPVCKGVGKVGEEYKYIKIPLQTARNLKSLPDNELKNVAENFVKKQIPELTGRLFEEAVEKVIQEIKNLK